MLKYSGDAIWQAYCNEPHVDEQSDVARYLAPFLRSLVERWQNGLDHMVTVENVLRGRYDFAQMLLESDFFQRLQACEHEIELENDDPEAEWLPIRPAVLQEHLERLI